MKNSAEEIGWIILKASRIEKLLRENGASGNGLRELADSLGDRLSPEIHELLRYIGTVRNMAAHQGEEADLEDWSPEFFSEACDAVTEVLTGEEKTAKNCTALLKFKYLAFIPGLHVLYPLELLAGAFYGTYFVICGLACTVLALYLTVITLTHRIWLLAPAALLLFAAGHIAALLFAEKWKLRHIPVVNSLVLIRELCSGIDYLKLFIALTLLGIPFIGGYLILRHGEFAAGGAVLALGYIVGIVTALIPIRSHS